MERMSKVHRFVKMIQEELISNESVVFQNEEFVSKLNGGKYKIFYYFKMIFLFLMYIFFIYNYIKFKACINRGSFFGFNIIWLIIFLLLNNNIELRRKKAKKYYLKFCILSIPLISVYVIEIMCNPFVNRLKLRYLFLNCVIIFIIEILFITILGEKLGLYLTITFTFLFGIINYFVIEFKGVPLMPSDFFAFGTAVDVVGQYKFFISDSVVWGFFIYMFEFFLIKCIGEHRQIESKRRHYVKRICVLLTCFLFFFLTYKIDFFRALNFEFNAWEPIESYYEYGSSLAFLGEMKQLKPDKVKGYSITKAEEILNRYENSMSEKFIITPNLVIIMNESFSDLSVLGNIDTDDYLSNWRSVDYVMRGNAYASQYGGGTCNTEFEVLTGSTMTFIPYGTYPYQNYSLKWSENLVKVFNDNNYSCIAIHPARAENWNRKIVYNDLGFDKFLDINKFENAEYYHMYVSDRSVYEKIENTLTEEKRNTMIFAVTMQDHGGYDLWTLGDTDLQTIGGDFSEYEYAVTYMTLLKKADEAFREFYDYIMEIEEPTIVCMFGDHQPNLGNEFTDYLMSTDKTGKSEFEKELSRYIVPYIIFSNCDVGLNRQESDLSLNYLGALLLKLTGYATPYFEFVNDMKEKIPIINLDRYMTNDFIWHDINESNIHLEEYRIIQYYNLFGKNNGKLLIK